MRCIWVCLLTGLVLMSLSPASSQTAVVSPPSPERLKELTEQQRSSPSYVLPACRQAFEQWVHDDPENKPLQAFGERLQALRSLRDRIGSRLKAASAAATGSLLDEILARDTVISQAKNVLPADVAPAEQVYAEYLPHFVQGIAVAGLGPTAQDFLKTFYNAEVQEMVEQTMRLGLALSCLDKASYELDYYLLLLPLLHSPVGFDARLLDSLPDRVTTTDKLTHMADFCLLRLGRPDAAAAIAIRLTKQQPSDAVLYQYYQDAAAKCVGNKLPNRAVQCLQQARGLFKPTDPKVVELRFRICDTWANSKNYALAAGEAGQIARDMPGTGAAGKAIYSRIKYFSEQGDSRSVLLEVDDALHNERCQPYEEELTYLKWVSLRKEGKGEQASHVLKGFLEAHPSSSCGAEMYYAVAVDCLAAQRYDESLQILQSLVEKYPTSPAVRQAQPLIDRLASFAGQRAATSQP